MQEFSYNDLARDSYWLIQSLEQWGSDTLFSATPSKIEAFKLASNLRKHATPEYLEEHGTRELDDKQSLIEVIQRFMNVLSHDLNLAETYVITQKRDRNMSILIYSAEQALSKRTIEQLSESCQKDIKEAGRCLAFDLPTACGFHVFRALETVVLMYFPVLRIKQPGKSQRNLGTLIALLEGRDISKKGRPIKPGAPKVDAKITGMLIHLKDFYRNPLIHPELTLEDDEAVSTFQFVISAIDVMVQDIVTRKPKPEPTSEEDIKS